MRSGDPENSFGGVKGDSEAGILLKPGRNIIGRAKKCDIVIRDITVSRRHAEISVTPLQIEILDLGSRNGTFINGTSVNNAIVRNGSRVRFGSVEFRIDGSPPVLKRCSNEVDPSTAAQFSDDYLDNPSPTIVLTPALERVLLNLLAGLSEKKIASKLRLSIHTVHNEVREIYRQYGVNSRAELLALFVRRRK
jgi:pSer/pThr/pTyr-binding forkhead associated (FHA) protein